MRIFFITFIIFLLGCRAQTRSFDISTFKRIYPNLTLYSVPGDTHKIVGVNQHGVMFLIDVDGVNGAFYITDIKLLNQIN